MFTYKKENIENVKLILYNNKIVATIYLRNKLKKQIT